jgi:transcriptional regulator
MYTPAHFVSTDLDWLDWLAEQFPFGTLISQAEGAPFATHLPVLYRREQDQAILTGHWARPNAQWREIEGQQVLFMFQGPHAYISPRWYADTPKQVPTWNYVAAHVYGKIRLVQEVGELERIVVSLADRFESGAPTPWRLADADPANRSRLKGIVGFELRSQNVQIKIKLNQNHPVANVEGVIAGLRATGSPEDAAVAELMQKELARR